MAIEEVLRTAFDQMPEQEIGRWSERQQIFFDQPHVSDLPALVANGNHDLIALGFLCAADPVPQRIGIITDIQIGWVAEPGAPRLAVPLPTLIPPAKNLYQEALARSRFSRTTATYLFVLIYLSLRLRLHRLCPTAPGNIDPGPVLIEMLFCVIIREAETGLDSEDLPSECSRTDPLAARSKSDISSRKTSDGLLYLNKPSGREEASP